MKNIADLLLKTIKVVFKGEEKKNLIISIIKKNTREELGRDDITFSGNSINLKTNPLLKTEIMLKKKVS